MSRVLYIREHTDDPMEKSNGFQSSRSARFPPYKVCYLAGTGNVPKEPNLEPEPFENLETEH